MAQTIVWDQGPDSGTYSGAWKNQTAAQNFADSVTFSQDTIVGGLNHFTTLDLSARTGPSDFRLKILSDAGGTPGSLLYAVDLGYTSFGASSLAGVNVATFSFAPQLFAANTTYWVGLSGNGFEAAQVSVRSPQDGTMAQFASGSFAFHTDVGDQMFQLTTPVPEPETYAMMLAGIGLIGGFARRRAQRTDA